MNSNKTSTDQKNNQPTGSRIPITVNVSKRAQRQEKKEAKLDGENMNQ